MLLVAKLARSIRNAQRLRHEVAANMDADREPVRIEHLWLTAKQQVFDWFGDNGVSSPEREQYGELGLNC
jgi:hypothetical protein